MGKPNIDKTLQHNAAAIKAVQEACDTAAKTLNNNIQAGENYINRYTKGIVQTFRSDATWYSKFSEEFSLDALNGIVDGIVNTATDAMAVYLSEGTDKELLEKTTKDTGALVKSILGLAASSSSAEENLEVNFSYIVVGDTNFAVYLGHNTATVAAQNVWGKKNIKVVAITYIVAAVNPNPDLTRARMLQDDLTTLRKLNRAYDNLLVEAATTGNTEMSESLANIKSMMDDTEGRITKELQEAGNQ